MKANTIGPVLALLWAATFWGVLWYPLRLLEAEGLSGLWTTWLIFTVIALPALWIVWPRRHLLRQQPGLLLLLAVVNGWLNTAFVLAVLDGNVVRVLLLFYLSPLWSTVLAWWWLGERPSRFGLATLLLAMLGALLMLWNPALGFPWPQDAADWLAISAGLGFSISNVLLRRLKFLPATFKAAVTWWGVVLVTGIWLLLIQAPIPVVSSAALVGAVLLGGLGISSVSLALIYGVKMMPIHRSAVILLFELVAGAVSAQLLTDEIVTPIEWAGGALIILAAYLSAKDSSKAARAASEASRQETTKEKQ